MPSRINECIGVKIAGHTGRRVSSCEWRRYKDILGRDHGYPISIYEAAGDIHRRSYEEGAVVSMTMHARKIDAVGSVRGNKVRNEMKRDMHEMFCEVCTSFTEYKGVQCL